MGSLPSLGAKVIFLILGGFFLPFCPGWWVEREQIAIANPVPPSCGALTVGETLAQQSSPQVKSAKANPTPIEHFPAPSLWWAKEQFDPFGGRLVEDWKIDVSLQQIDLQVNRQLWSSLDYVNRYQFVNKLGNVARESHYNLRILNEQNKCLAIYYCQFDTVPNQCELQIETSQRSGFRVNPSFENWTN